MKYNIYAGQLSDIDFAPNSEAAEILQNIRTILTTVRNSVPLDRRIGISADYIDAPTLQARAEAEAEIFIAVAKYEPRARVTRIGWQANAEGRLLANIEVELNEET